MNEHHDRPSQETKVRDHQQLGSERLNTFATRFGSRPSQPYSKINNEGGHSLDHFQELRKLIEYTLNRSKTQSEENLLNIGDKDGNVELSLELEIDESLRDILLEPNKKDAGLNNLNVTLIQETASQEKTTLALGVDEVTQLLELVQNSNPQPEPKNIDISNRKPNSFAIESTTDSEDCENYPLLSQNTTVYTTPQHTFDHIRKKLPCQVQPRPSADERKPGTPCLCQHCGMVGLLVESQKRPAIPHAPNPKFSLPGSRVHHQHQPHKRRIVDLRSKSKSETNLILLKELCNKVANIEERLNDQEEQSVRKDYFKFVIHKLLSQYSNKINELRSKSGHNEGIKMTVATQYSKRNVTASQNAFSNVRPFKDIEKATSKLTEAVIKHRTTKTEQTVSKRSGSDLTSDAQERNRLRTKRQFSKYVVKEQSGSNKPKTSRKIYNSPRGYYKDGLSPSSDDYKEVYVSNGNNHSMYDKEKNFGKSLEKDLSAHAVKNMCDVVYSKYYSGKNYDEVARPLKEIPEKLLKCTTYRNRCSLPKQSANRMDVAFVSPATKNWHEHASEQEFASPNSTLKRDHAANNNNNFKSSRHTIEEKIEYLRALAHRKNVDEGELWTNILNQAKKHIKSNEDTVSIQLPGAMKDRRMSELELTLSTLKEIVKSTKGICRTSSGLSMHL